MSLQELGFSDSAERLYLALLDAPEAPLDELAGKLELEESAVRSELAGLAELKVVELDLARANGFAVPHPTRTVTALIERLEDELIRRYRRVSDLRSTVAALDAKLSAGLGAVANTAEPGIERVEGLAAVRERIEELAFFTRSTLSSIQPGGPQSKEALEASRPLDERLVRRKVQIRLIHDSSVLADELNRVYLRELVIWRAQIRVTSSPIERMIIFDRQVAVVPIEPGNSRRGALIVRQPALLVGLNELFEHTWGSSQDLPWNADGAAPAAPEQTISDEDRQVLTMLASGCTDETAAREIGISVRHLRRRISRLMSDLGANSRFEAGAEASRRGWL